MKATINKSRAVGNITAPPSKSMAHRNLLCAALSERSTVFNVEYSQDILATLDSLKALGANIEINGSTVNIGGFYPEKVKGTTLDCRESGSTLRFILPLCLLSGEEFILKGQGRLLQRPMTVYSDLCREKGIDFEQTDEYIRIKGRLKGGKFTVDGGISSQFISGLLFALPLLKEDSVINIVGEIQSYSYLLLTFKSLTDFGIDVDYTDIRSIKIKGNQTYKNKEVKVEGDYSNAAFFDALNFLDGDVKVEGLAEDSLQGDRVYKELFDKLNKENSVISIADCPDLAPILFVMAAVGNGALFTDTARLKIKESDRAAAMQEELSKFGVKMDVDDNSIRVYASKIKTPTEEINGHNDHRIVMATAILATKTGAVINGAEAVRKSLPDFFERLGSLNINVS
ncbi:MAG: 3-phosphoshikimate 1-carboxyvinyltransferase [Ruminococcaceae bacterium]|nr:3-phosphoshikimate 1-carboxyvinyltransferase [Oscillospiraceae bacterium]